jgi:chorismate synthase
MSINAVKGFEIGSGFAGTEMRWSEHNDLFIKDTWGHIHTKTNHAGGTLWWITNGEDIIFRTAIKPVATIEKAQETLDKAGNKTLVEGKGRHDPCVLPRAIPIVEAMAALVVMDFVCK